MSHCGVVETAVILSLEDVPESKKVKVVCKVYQNEDFTDALHGCHCG